MEKYLKNQLRRVTQEESARKMNKCMKDQNKCNRKQKIKRNKLRKSKILFQKEEN